MQGKLEGKVTGTKLSGRVTLPGGDAAPFTATVKGDCSGRSLVLSGALAPK